jgi:hypothetical protein
MSQRRALIASIVITLVLAFSAIGIRAWMGTPTEASSTANDPAPVTLLTQAGASLGGDQAYGDDDEANQSFTSYQQDDHEDDEHSSYQGGEDHEEDHDDD